MNRTGSLVCRPGLLSEDSEVCHTGEISDGGRWRVGEGWLTVGQAAKILGVHADTVREWADAGRLVAGRLPGGHRRIDPASVAALYREIYGTDPPASD